MRNWMIATLAIAAMAVGCSNKKSSNATAPAVQHAALDVPATPPVTYTPPPQPVIAEAPVQQPVIEETAVDVSEQIITSTPARSAPSRTAGRKYTVRKGESLWSIAEDRYGSGNKWKVIAAANPRIDPDRIQAGQTIVLP